MDAQWLKTQFELQPEKSKAVLARALDLEPSAISKMLNDTRQIKAPEYVAMRRFFGLPSDGRQAVEGAANSYIVEPLEADTGLRENEHNGDSQWIIPAQIIEPRTKAAAKNIKSFCVEDNMMAPDFNRGEHVLVDLSDVSPSPPGPFVISDGFGTMIRNCECVPNSNPVMIKISALKESFAPQLVAKENAHIIGRVIAKLQWL